MRSGDAFSLNRAAARALVATVEIVGLSAAGHVTAGGSLPAPGYLLALGAAVFVASMCTVAQLLRVWVVVPLVLAAQVGLHLGFVHTAMAGPSDGMHAMPASGHSQMFSAHVVAMVLTALVLLLQSQAASRLASWLRQLVTAPAPVPVTRLGGPLSRPVRRQRRLLLAAAPRRGPPRGCAIAA